MFVLDGRNRQRDRDEVSVLRSALGVEVLDALTLTDASKNGGHFRWVVRRGQHRDGMPDSLRGGIAKQALGGAIPTGDDAVRVFADNRVNRGIDNRREMTGNDLRIA